MEYNASAWLALTAEDRRRLPALVSFARAEALSLQAQPACLRVHAAENQAAITWATDLLARLEVARDARP